MSDSSDGEISCISDGLFKFGDEKDDELKDDECDDQVNLPSVLSKRYQTFKEFHAALKQ